MTEIRIVLKVKMNLRLAVIQNTTVANPPISNVKTTNVYREDGNAITKTTAGTIQTKKIVLRETARNPNSGATIGNV